MQRWGFMPKRIITDKLCSYGAAERVVAPGLEYRIQMGLSNCTENTHLAFRQRVRIKQGHQSPGALQRFAVLHSATRSCFSVPLRRRAAQTIRYQRLETFDLWNAAASLA